MRISGIFLKKQKNNQINRDNEQTLANNTVIKKRENERINEIMKVSPVAEHVPNSYGDRFIPRRYVMDNNLQNLYISKDKRKMENNNIDFIDTRKTDGYWRKHNFKILLNNVLQPECKRYLKFSDTFVEQNKSYYKYKKLPIIKNSEIFYKNFENYDWMCRPRFRPLALEDASHDLPEHFYAIKGKNIMCWSAKGQMAALFWNKIIFWHPHEDETRVYYLRNITAINFNPSGNLLAITRIKRQRNILQILDVSERNSMYLSDSYYLQDHKVACIEWDNIGESLVCGYENGEIQIFETSKLYRLKTLKYHNNEIYSIKFSSNMKYFATSDIKGLINIFLWYSFKFIHKIETFNKIPIFMEWHPWVDYDLIIVEQIPATISVFHIPSLNVIAYYKRKDNKVKFDSFAINKLTAELFIGCTIDNSDELSYEVIVLASLDQIVDVLKNESSTIKSMLWSPNNLQLAVISDDDMIAIWNVFSINSEKYAQTKIPDKKHKNYEYDKTKGYSIWQRLKSIR